MSTTASSGTAASPSPSVFLPRHLVPRRYAVSLAPDLVACTFTGSLSLEAELVEAGHSTVVLHAHQLAVRDVVFTPGAPGSAPVPAVRLAYDVPAQTLTLSFAQPLPAGRGTLACAFAGTLNDELAGFYRSRYAGPDGAPRYAAVTQFEATDARRCFPCLDEPDRKAVFSLTVTAPADRVALSGGAVARVSTSKDGRARTTTFEDTPVQSTYLVALCVGEWDVVSATHGRSGITTNVWTPPGGAAHGEFALKAGVDSLELLSSLFDVPYFGGRKVDHVALKDFAAGAMENTGCITYREAALLIDASGSSLAMRQRVAQVVAHELSHQFFGNLVTMKWWDGLWLNEGFAKFMEYAVTSRLFPEWRPYDIFVASVQSTAFGLDAMASTHAIEVDVKTPEEINEIFDTISYMKGASVIRMLFAFLGEEVGFKGLHIYLTRHAHGNATTEDLWAALGEASGQPVAAVMRRWTRRAGHPYVALARAPDGGYALSSGRHIAPWARDAAAWPAAGVDFVGGAGLAAAAAAAARLAVPAKDAADAATNHNEDWCIPLSAVVGGGGGGGGGAPARAALGVLALDADARAGAPGLAPGDGSRAAALAAAGAALTAAARARGAPGAYVKINAGHAAFFRTLYEPAALAALAPAVATPAGGGAPELGVADRVGLVGDVAAGVATGATPTLALLGFLAHFKREEDYNVWVAILDAVGGVADAVAALPAPGAAAAGTAALHAYTAALLRGVVARVGWDAASSEDANTPLLRAMVLRAAAVAGDADVVAEALKRFAAAGIGAGARAGAAGAADGGFVAVPADLKQLVYNTAAASGGDAAWEALLRELKSAPSSEEARRLITALGRSPEPRLLSRALGLLLPGPDGDGVVRSQDTSILVSAVASNPGDAGRRLAWGFLKAHWRALEKRLGGGFMVWAGVISAAIKHFDARADADDVQAWFAKHPAGAAERAVKQALERVRTVAWRAHVLAGEAPDVAAAIKALAV